ncbi:MAG: hypothetical protein IJK23_08035 [Clostridia bacterium]|nr:hypothetical protein [Clostridia bacterium]
MNVTKLLARRMLERSKTSLVLSILISALSVASTLVVFSICSRGFSAFLTQTRSWGDSPAAAALHGLTTLLVVSAQFFLHIFVGESGSASIKDLFSERASVETQPTLLLLTAVCALTVSYFTLKILFAVHKKERRHFYSALLSAGASPSFAQKCAREEGRYLSVRAVPAGVALGYLAVLLVNAGETLVFRAASSRLGGEIRHDRIGFSLTAGVAAALFGYLFIMLCTGGAVKELTVKHTAAETRERLGANIGVSVFTMDGDSLKTFGLPHHIAVRSIENHIEKYMSIFFANAIYMSVCGISILCFFIVADYNGMKFDGDAADTSHFLLASTVRYISASAAMQFLSVFGTFFAMISNFEANNGCYVLMRALGASERMILRAVRREGLFCVLIGGVFCSFFTVFLFCLLYNIYGRGAGLTLPGLLCALGGILAMTAVYAVGVAAAVRVTCRRIGGLDLIRELKEFSYS